jgi:hypothetical protein
MSNQGSAHFKQTGSSLDDQSDYMSTNTSLYHANSKLSHVAKKIARTKAVLNKNHSVLTAATSLRSSSACASTEAKLVSINDIGPMKTFKRKHVKNSSISGRSNLSNSSSLRSTIKLSSDRESVRKVKQSIREDEKSVIQMYYSNMDQVIKSQTEDQPIDGLPATKPLSLSRPGTTTKTTIKFSKLSMAQFSATFCGSHSRKRSNMSPTRPVT